MGVPTPDTVTKTTKDKKYPTCFGNMYSLTDAEMMEKCLSCPHFRRCEKGSPNSIEIDMTPASIMIPPEPETDTEYSRVRW